jgi:hypothetical protein
VPAARISSKGSVLASRPSRRKEPAFVPTAHPAHPPAIDAIAECNGLEEPQELGLNFHSDRTACDRFNPRKVARYSDDKIAALMAEPGIVRNRLKIGAAIYSPADGVVVTPYLKNRVGQFAHRADLLCKLAVSGARTTVEITVPEKEAADLASDIRWH